MEEPRWTLDELADRVDAALAVDYHGQPSGRVRDVPDRRAIRWYTTIGLIDRPVAHRGRTALYGPRHLLQLVAVKRLQAKGLPLVAIQQELAGATDTELGRVARLPAPAGVVPPAVPAPRRLAAGPTRRAAFWRNPPVAALTAEAAVATAATAEPAGTVAATGASDAMAVPAELAETVAATAAMAEPGELAGAVDTAAGAAATADPEAPVLPGAGVATLRGIRLAGEATLLLEPGRDLDAADLRAILDAARPLLAVLRDRRLAGVPDPASAAPEPASPEIDLPRRRAADGEPRREHP